MENDKLPEAVMLKVRERFDRSNQSLEELGLKMGYPKESARKSAWQFLYKTKDPRLSMVCKFAKAMGISIKSLL